MAELLAPAGNIEALNAAIGEGADAVYMGLKSFNARLRTMNFAWNQFEAAVEAVHKRGKKIFVTVNTLVEEGELERLYRFLEYLQRVGPDGLIVQDMGTIRMIQEFFPDLRIHASTQLNASSAHAANLLAKEGVKRVVLARELGLSEIQAIRQKTNIELEVFVHGALCVSESGLCMFSSFLGGKSANRGMCTQACRRFYGAEKPSGQEQGYYFSPYDLQLIDYIPDLVQAGVESFKIEGRMKSAEYVGTVTAAYRYVLDHWQEDKKAAIETAKRILATDFARKKTSYWYESSSAENLLDPKQAGGTGIYLGKIEKIRYHEKTKQPYIFLRGGSYEPEIGDSIRLHKKDDSNRVSHKVKEILEYAGDLFIDAPKGFSNGDTVYLLQTKSMSKRHPFVLPKDLSKYRRQPGAGTLPLMELERLPKNSLDYFPQGLYVQVSTVEDFHAVLHQNNVRYILEFNFKTKEALLDNMESLPVSKKQVIISLDPFYPQDLEESLQQDMDDLVALGYESFMVNNLGHFALFDRKKTNLIAGPYLYTMNRWAASFLENQNIEAFVSSYENSRKNLEASFEQVHRKKILVPLFAYPALFRMRFTLPESYDFNYFTDKEGEMFKSLSTPDGSFVLPEKPFSILDKYSQMQSAGFSRFLIDLSKTKVAKGTYKQLLRSMYTAEPLEDISRFNWAEGFYDPEKIAQYKKANLNRETFSKSRPRRPKGS